jgi:putrescine transport system permease protein
MVIYSKVKLGVSPDVNAMASLIIAAVGSCVILASVIMRRAERAREREARLAGT